MAFWGSLFSHRPLDVFGPRKTQQWEHQSGLGVPKFESTCRSSFCLTSNIDSIQQFYWITVTSSLCAATNLVSNSQLGFHNVFALFCYIVYFFHYHNQDVARHESNKAIQLILPRFCTTKIYLTLIYIDIMPVGALFQIANFWQLKAIGFGRNFKT